MISKITKQHLKEAGKKPVYKVVRVENNILRSLWVEGTKECPDHIWAGDENIPMVTLTYKPDRVISDGRYGIWCCETIKAAINQTDCNGGNGLCKIYKVYPIGQPIKPPPGWGISEGTVLYPAVIMGECVKVVDNRRQPWTPS